MQQKHDRYPPPQKDSAAEAAETACRHASTAPFTLSLLADARTHQLQKDILKQGGFAFVNSVMEVRAGDATAAEAAYDMAWEQLHSGPWHAVHEVWRDAFSLSCMLMSLTLTLPGQKREALRYLDLGLLMGASLFQKDIGNAIDFIQSAGKAEMYDSNHAAEELGFSVKSKYENSDLILDETLCKPGDFCSVESEGKRRSESDAECEASAKGNKEQSACSIRGHIPQRFNVTVSEHARVCRDSPLCSEPASTTATCQISELPVHSITTFAKNSDLIPERSLQCDAIERKFKPSLEEFLCCNLLPGIPVIVTGAMSHWSALRKWKSMDYLQEVAGDRTVPVEVGRHYLMDEWRQDLVTFSELLRHIFEPQYPSTACIYLAQHPLFEQIPKLKEDIVIPDYCAIGGDSVHTINAWFGPAGTVTPLHYDPDCNLFAQVVGKKYVRLYPASVSESLYPYSESMLQNSSQVDLDNPNYEKYPMAKNLPFMDCILEEGEMLYIPPKWWHYVRSLSPSFSASFWWRNLDLSG